MSVKVFAKFTLKQLRPVTMLKGHSSSDVFTANSEHFLETTLNDCFPIFPSELIDHVWACFIVAFERDEYHKVCNWKSIPC